MRPMFGTFRRLDGAHAPVVGGVHVAHLDGRALPGETAGAQGREPAAVGETGQRVGLVHELRELRAAEELLEGRHHRADVDDGLRRDGVDVLGGHALAHHALHAVEAHAEGFLHQLAHHAQAAVAEVLVLVQAVGHLVPRQAGGHFGQVAGFLEQVLVVDGQRHRDQLASPGR